VPAPAGKTGQTTSPGRLSSTALNSGNTLTAALRYCSLAGRICSKPLVYVAIMSLTVVARKRKTGESAAGRRVYTGAIDIGTGADRQRLKRKGRTKRSSRNKLRKAVAELEAGMDTSDTYSVEQAARDRLA
jgi:hypothetical protein